MTDEPRKIVCNEENRPPLPAELSCTSYDKDALHDAVYENDAALFDYLVKPNVDLNCRNSLGETPLLMGIRRKASPALIKRLLDLGCDINIIDEHDRTPLHVAILNRNVEITQKLIELGTDLDVQDLHTRETPLFYAIKNNDIEAVCMLLCYGADVTIKNAQNYTPLTYAMVNCRQDIILILLDYCDDFNYRDNDGYTPLHLVIQYGSDLAIQRLIDAGVDVNVITKHGYCALVFAIYANAGADVFKKLWDRMNVNVLLQIRSPLLLTYIGSLWRPYNSANAWVECLYLMLESPIAIDLMHRCMMYYSGMGYGLIKELLYSLRRRNVTSRDRQNIINICLTLGAEVTVSDLDVAIHLFDFKEELNTLVYATKHYRNEEIHHPLLPLIIGLSDFDFLKTMWWCRDNIRSQDEVLVKYITISCLGFFSLTPFWKQKMLQDCRWNSYSNEFVEKIETASEFPSLLELSRNKAHSVIRKMCTARKPYQFHDAVKSLPLPGAIINLLLFKRPVYKKPDWFHRE